LFIKLLLQDLLQSWERVKLEVNAQGFAIDGNLIIFVWDNLGSPATDLPGLTRKIDVTIRKIVSKRRSCFQQEMKHRHTVPALAVDQNPYYVSKRDHIS
jgi:hypothetical protein